MVKIFSKLKLIIGVTILLITILFSILIVRQYQEFIQSKDQLDEELISELNHNTSIILDFYKKLATSYYEESFVDNEDLLTLLDLYSHPLTSVQNTHSTEISAIIDQVFANAQKNGFTYIQVYDANNQLIHTATNQDNTEQALYNFSFSLHLGYEKVGNIIIGLPASSVISTLDRTTHQATFALYQKSSFPSKELAKHKDNYMTSDICSEYLINKDQMDRLYSYSNAVENKVFNTFMTSIESIVYEPLHLHKNFILDRSFNGNFYSLIFITFDNKTNKDKGFYTLFTENSTLSAIRENLTISIGLFIGLYLTLMFIIAFIYYILHYLYNFSYTDNLTKAYNRHKFFEVIKHNIYDYHRYNYMFSVIIIDIDNFKNINDQLGHNAGDEVLVQFVEIIQASLRTTDYLFRWGGEEFLVLLSHCKGKTAYQVAEKLRSNIASHDFELKSSTHVTASFGVASYKSSSNVEMIVSHADKALYHSKNTGKNCTTLYSVNL